jgi:hypothetical protein
MAAIERARWMRSTCSWLCVCSGGGVLIYGVCAAHVFMRDRGRESAVALGS